MAKDRLPVYHIRDFETNLSDSGTFYFNSFRNHITQNSFLKWPFSHDFYIIAYFTRGSGSLMLDFISHPVENGSLFIMLPGQVHNYHVNDDAEGKILFFSKEFLDGYSSVKKLGQFSFLRDPSLILKIDKASSEYNPVNFLYSELEHESVSNLFGHSDLLKDYIDILLIKLFRMMPGNGDNSLKNNAQYLLMDFEKLIEEYYLSHHPPGFYADKLHITTKYLNQLCKKHLVKTTTQLIHERVALEAKRLLAYHHLHSNEVAGRLNFEDHSYFTRFFKKMTGLTPNVFKKTTSK